MADIFEEDKLRQILSVKQIYLTHTLQLKIVWQKKTEITLMQGQTVQVSSSDIAILL